MKNMPPIKFVGSAILVLCTAAFMPVGHTDTIINFLSEAGQSQIAQYGFFFTLAAFIHAGRVKKEIKNSFEGITVAIDNVTIALKEDLKKHGESISHHGDILVSHGQILKSHGEKLDNITGRVDILESKQPKKKEIV